jgi:hypothetical protein
MSITTAISWGVALVLCAGLVWICWRRRSRNPFTTRSGTIVDPPKMAAMPNAAEALVYVNEDGSVRELTEAEKKYVDTEFSPLDGARPYVKSRYSDRTAWGVRGYLPRTLVPYGTSIRPAPSQSALHPQTPQAATESLMELVRRHGRS